MFPIALFGVVRVVAGLNILTAVLPNGDVERTMLRETPTGVEALVESVSASTGQSAVQKRVIPAGRYGWRIEEERRTVIKAAKGHTAGTVRRAFLLSAWIDATPNPNAPPTPMEAFHFYAPNREAAEALRERLKKALGARR